MTYLPLRGGVQCIAKCLNKASAKCLTFADRLISTLKNYFGWKTCFVFNSCFESNPPLYCLCSQPNQVEVNSPFFTSKCIIMHFNDVDVSVDINVLVSSMDNSSPGTKW